MTTASFSVGQKICFNRQFLMLMHKVSDDLWQLEDSRTHRIVEHEEKRLQELYVSGELTFVKDLAHLMPSLGNENVHVEMDEQAFDQAKIKRSYVLAIMDLPGTKEKIKPAIYNMWVKLGRVPANTPDCATVLRWKRKYIEGGKDIHALVEQHQKKGNRTHRYTADVMGFVTQAVETTYLTRERKTVQDTVDKALALTIYENKLRPAADRLPLPTRRLVERMIYEAPAFDRDVARHGHVAAVRKYRAVLGHRVTAAPLERAEIDHTQLDLHVIDSMSGLPMGRPYVTACIDDHTRCILGLHIGFEPPSYVTVAHCLKHAFLPKTGLRTTYPAIQNDWKAYGVMSELVVDNGMEFHSKALEQACGSLGIEIHYAARKTPWFKGKIERFFGTMERGVAHGTPGTSFANIIDKGDYDPLKHAVITLEKLQEIINLWVVDVYHQQVHRRISCPPSVMWDNNIVVSDIRVPANPKELDIVMGKSASRKLTHKGVEIDFLYYNSDELRTLRMREGGKLNVEVRINDSDLGHIFVISPDKSQHFQVPAVAFSYANGLTRWQHEFCKRIAARDMKRYDPESWILAKDRIACEVREALLTKKSKDRAKKSRFATSGRGGSSVNHAVNVTSTHVLATSEESGKNKDEITAEKNVSDEAQAQPKSVPVEPKLAPPVVRYRTFVKELEIDDVTGETA